MIGRRRRRVAAADGSGDETEHETPVAPTLACPVCGAAMVVVSEATLPEFGALEIKLHHLSCEQCGMQTDRIFHPDVGYRAVSR